MVFEVGRLVIKVSGRDAGRLGVVVKELDENYVVVSGPKKLTGLRDNRKVNKKHLRPLEIKIEISENPSEDELINKMKEAIKKLSEDQINRLKINKKMLNE